MKYCPNHHENPDEAMFCHECGEPLIDASSVLDKKCPNCSAANPKDAKFCHNCGVSLLELEKKTSFRFVSDETCEKIIFDGDINIFTNVRYAEFIMTDDSSIDVVFSRNGINFKKTIKYKDLQEDKIYRINWGKVSFKGPARCNVTVEGDSVPKAIKGRLKDISLGLPYGKYEILFELDGITERKTLLVSQPSQCIEVNINIPVRIISSEECDKIIINGGIMVFNNAKKVNFKMAVDSSMDILFSRNGVNFRRSINYKDIQKDKIYEIDWCRLVFTCPKRCNVRIQTDSVHGRINNVSPNIDVPYGEYIIQFELDGEVERKVISAFQKSLQVKTKIEEKFKYIVACNIPVLKCEVIGVDNIVRFVKSHNENIVAAVPIEVSLPKGKYTVNLRFKDGSYENVTINVTKPDETLNLNLCHLRLETNAKEVEIGNNGITTRHKIANGNVSLYTIYLSVNIKYILDNNVVLTETINIDKPQITIRRIWRSISFKFSSNISYGIKKNVLSDSNIIYSPNCNDKTPDSFHISRPYHGSRSIYLSEGKHLIDYGIDDSRFIQSQKTFVISDSTKELSFNVSEKKTNQAKWRWLRKTIFWFSCILSFLMAVSVLTVSIAYPYFEHFKTDMTKIFYLLTLMAQGIGLPILWDFYHNKSRRVIKRFSYLSGLVILFGFLCTMGGPDINFDEYERWQYFGVPFEVIFISSIIIFIWEVLRKHVWNWLKIVLFFISFVSSSGLFILVIISGIYYANEYSSWLHGALPVTFFSVSVICLFLCVCFMVQIINTAIKEGYSSIKRNYYGAIDYGYLIPCAIASVFFGLLCSCSIHETFDWSLANDRWGMTLVPLVGYGIIWLIAFPILKLKIKGWDNLSDLFSDN